MSKQINWIDFFLKCFRNRKNISIYTSFWRDRPMVLINGYDETVHRGPFQLYRIHWIADGGLGFDLCDKRYKHIISSLLDRDPTL